MNPSRLPQPAKIAVAAVLASTTVVAIWAALSRATSGSIKPPPLAYLMPTTFSWRSRIAKATIMTESRGRYDAINHNTDGAGISFGLISWAQKPGSLGTLLQAMKNADPARFAAIFGPGSDRLLAAAKQGGVLPVDGAYLWQAPWEARFQAAGRDPVFKKVQDDLVLYGEYMRAAIDAAAKIGGVPTERSMSVLFDRAVQQGPGALSKAVAYAAGTTFDERVKAVATAAIRISPAQWRALVQSRVAAILSDPFLTNDPVNLLA